MQTGEINLKELTIDEKEMQNQEKNKVKKAEEKKTYSYDEALKSSIKYFKGDELAATVWISKYALVITSYSIHYTKLYDT